MQPLNGHMLAACWLMAEDSPHYLLEWENPFTDEDAILERVWLAYQSELEAEHVLLDLEGADPEEEVDPRIFEDLYMPRSFSEREKAFILEVYERRVINMPLWIHHE